MNKCEYYKNKNLALFSTLENDATFPHVYIYRYCRGHFCHAYITKFRWKLVALQFNFLNLLENRCYHTNQILSEYQGAAFYKNGYVFVLMFGIFSQGPAQIGIPLLYTGKKPHYIPLTRFMSFLSLNLCYIEQFKSRELLCNRMFLILNKRILGNSKIYTEMHNVPVLYSFILHVV